VLSQQKPWPTLRCGGGARAPTALLLTAPQTSARGKKAAGRCDRGERRRWERKREVDGGCGGSDFCWWWLLVVVVVVVGGGSGWWLVVVAGGGG